ncbi:MAG: bifunctional metallophosphatase/5'-nucleotidase [Clostridiales bacterium]|nr:MAG: bifunctional metallophosphatase/5'-nucleotidase [Clostridiales bacterium]
MKKIRIIYTSDIHGYIMPKDYRSGEVKNIGLFSIFKNIEKDENTLIIDGGDTIQGSNLATYLALEKDDPSLIAKAMNLCKYDFVTIGNHDFNYGIDYLNKYLNHLEAKCICANVKGNIDTLDYAIKEINGLKIGIVGVTTDFINVWEKKENLKGVTVKNTYDTLKDFFNKNKLNVDILIGLYHGGISYDFETKELLSNTSENIAYQICRDFNFDILLSGHQHMRINDKLIEKTHLFQTPENAVEALEIILHYENKNLQVKSRFFKGETEDSFEKDFINIENEIDEYLDRPLGSLNEDIVTPPPLERALHGSALANLVNKIQLEYTGADISVTSLANEIPKLSKNLTIRGVLNTYVYFNTLEIKELSGKVLKEAIEQSLSYFKLDNNKINISDSFLKPKVEHYNYDFYYNVEFKADISKEVGSRLTEIKFKGKTVKDDDTFKVCVSNYRASGTGGYNMYKDSKTIKTFPDPISDIIMDYIRKHKNIIVNKESNYIIEH